MLRKWVVGVLGAAIVGLGGMTPVLADHDSDMNCDQFSSGEEVYEFWTSHEYSAENDPDDLDREDDGRPCESLTEDMVDQFATYESEVAGTTDDDETEGDDTTTEDDATDDETAGAEEGSEDEGDALPVTATSYPTMMLMGLLTAGAGALVLFRRKATQA